jgi:hypothetical protein
MSAASSRCRAAYSQPLIEACRKRASWPVVAEARFEHVAAVLERRRALVEDPDVRTEAP